MFNPLLQINNTLDTDGLLSPAADNSKDSTTLRAIDELNREAEQRWNDRLVLETALSRSLVSFQANKNRAAYRWFKYKEAFSAELVEYLVSRYHTSKGVVIRPVRWKWHRTICSRWLWYERRGH